MNATTVTDAEIQKLIEDAVNARPGEPCQECGKRPAVGLFLPERYAPDYSPGSFSPSELVARCKVCVAKRDRMAARRRTKSAPGTFKWM